MDNLSTISQAILDAVQLHDQKKAYKQIKQKLNELNNVIFQSNAEIQKNYVINIGKLKLSRNLIENKLPKFEPEIQSLWEIIIEKIDNQIKKLKQKKKKNWGNQI